MIDYPELYLFNTMSRKKEKFIPQEPNKVSFYSCGQTVYQDIHVGNAKTYVAWDLLWRTLVTFGYDVMHIQNFTDVGHLTDDGDDGDDKIQTQAKSMNTDPMELVDSLIFEYHNSMDAINVHRPNISPRATSHISEMIQMVETLIDKGYAYEIKNDPGTFYYDTTKFAKYGELAKLNLEGQIKGSRKEVKIITQKKNPSDFALWIKAPENHIMKYISPKYGSKILGYPGWHLECSAMAQKYLGDTIDIHAGGVDHIPVHHTNEIAQSEAITNKQFANYWLHSEFITINGEKMSKSLNNYMSLSDLIQKIGAGPTKLLLLQAHYRTQSDFSLDKAESIKIKYTRFIRSYHLGIQKLSQNSSKKITNINSKLSNAFFDALADDLNSPMAISKINELTKSIDDIITDDGKLDTTYLNELTNTFELFFETLGIPYQKLDDDEIQLVNQILENREKYRTEKDWAKSDMLRDILEMNGYTINDTNKGHEWFKLH